MKQILPVKSIALILLSSAMLMTACGSNNAANAENKDTVSTYIEPQPDNATVRPDTMKTQVPQDSAKSDKMK